MLICFYRTVSRTNKKKKEVSRAGPVLFRAGSGQECQNDARGFRVRWRHRVMSHQLMSHQNNGDESFSTENCGTLSAGGFDWLDHFVNFDPDAWIIFIMIIHDYLSFLPAGGGSTIEISRVASLLFVLRRFASIPAIFNLGWISASNISSLFLISGAPNFSNFFPNFVQMFCRDPWKHCPIPLIIF